MDFDTLDLSKARDFKKALPTLGTAATIDPPKFEGYLEEFRTPEEKAKTFLLKYLKTLTK